MWFNFVWHLFKESLYCILIFIHYSWFEKRLFTILWSNIRVSNKQSIKPVYTLQWSINRENVFSFQQCSKYCFCFVLILFLCDMVWFLCDFLLIYIEDIFKTSTDFIYFHIFLMSNVLCDKVILEYFFYFEFDTWYYFEASETSHQHGR